MGKTTCLLFVVLGLFTSGCLGLPFAPSYQNDEPEQFMTDHPGHDHTGMDHTGMDHTDHDHDMGGHGDMKMYFHTSVHNTILFEKWHTMEWWELLLSCIAVGVFAGLYEGFKYLREFIAKKTNKRQVATINPALEKGPGYGSREMVIEEDIPSAYSSFLSTSHIIQSLLHFVQLFLSYSLMLVFMTYSVYLCLSLCLGGAVGYFLFGYARSYKADNEHCN